MAWSDRNKGKKISPDNIRRLIACSDPVVHLKSPESATGFPCSPPIKFSTLTGLGIKSEFVGNAVEDLSALKAWLSNADDMVMGYFSYGCKDILENLSSENTDSIGFPKFHFFIPESVILVNGKDATIYSHKEIARDSTAVENLETIIGNPIIKFSRGEYLKKVTKLKQHIQLGDVYEVNFCVENGFRNAVLNPLDVFERLQKENPAPFSCYVSDNGKFLMGSSPERFMMKNGTKIIAQPIKGTNRRLDQNASQLQSLLHDPKELAENIMITDLMRNDLSKSAAKGSVKVEELCGVYAYEHVNQMISTVSAQIKPGMHPADVLLRAFPMGSMTGAPKVKAMQLIEKYENFDRGLYSGAVGYFTPELDFDFNVVIRSILYNKDKRMVTFPTGGAITVNSDPESEYEECMLKAEAMRKVLMSDGS